MTPKKRVMIIEDDPDTIELLGVILELRGYEPIPAYGGQAGLQKLEDGPVDLILLDLMMDDIDGWTVLGTIKADGTGFKAIKSVDREMQFANPARFRLLLKYSLIEFYLDDVLIECYSLPGPATGRIGAIGELSDLRAWLAE